MRKGFVYLFIVFTAFFIVAATNVEAVKNPRSLVYYSPCDTPLPYKIGSIDSRFGVTEDQLRQDIFEAAKLWSDVYGKKLFVYDEKADLTIYMVYDRRQSLNQQIGELEGKLAQDKNAVESQIQEFERRSADFKRRVEDLNSQIDYWNAKGGAPREEYDKLKEQQQALKKESDELQALARSLNRSAAEFNSEVSELNETVESFNQAIAERPEQGLYVSMENRIDIYLTSSNQELIHTLAHELGHALGMDHVENSDSIMYKSTSYVTEPSESDIQELKEACKERTVFEGLLVKVKYLLYQWQNK